EIFDAVEKVNNTADSAETDLKDGQTSNQEKVQQLKEILSNEITDSIRDNVLYELIIIKEKDRNSGKSQLIKSVTTVLNNGVRIENIHSANEEVKTEIKYSTLTPEIKQVVTDLTDFAIVENSFFDVEKTMEARKDAVSNVEPV